MAGHGLGLYIYAGEDLPEAEQEQPQVEKPPAPKAVAQKFICADCGQVVTPCTLNGKEIGVRVIAQNAQKKYGRCLCADCSQKQAAKNENKGE